MNGLFAKHGGMTWPTSRLFPSSHQVSPGLTRSLRELQNQAVNAEDRDPRDVVHIKSHRQNLAAKQLKGLKGKGRSIDVMNIFQGFEVIRLTIDSNFWPTPLWCGHLFRANSPTMCGSSNGFSSPKPSPKTDFLAIYLSSVLFPKHCHCHLAMPFFNRLKLPWQPPTTSPCLEDSSSTSNFSMSVLRCSKKGCNHYTSQPQNEFGMWMPRRLRSILVLFKMIWNFGVIQNVCQPPEFLAPKPRSITGASCSQLRGDDPDRKHSFPKMLLECGYCKFI